MSIKCRDLKILLRVHQEKHPLDDRYFPSKPELAALLNKRAKDYGNEMKVMLALYYCEKEEITLDYLKYNTELDDESCLQALWELDKDNWIRFGQGDEIAINRYKIFAYCRR